MNIEFEAKGIGDGAEFCVKVASSDGVYSVTKETPGERPDHRGGLIRHQALCLYTLHVFELHILQGVQFDAPSLPMPE